MNNLINVTNQNGNLVVSSREVAVNFEKSNSVVNRSIENLIKETSMQNCTHLFIESTYKDSYDRDQKEYLLTRDGFSLLVMGFTGAKALEWKLKYIEAFNKMEQELKQPKQLTAREELRLHYQVMEEHEERIVAIDNKVNQLESNMPLFNVECKELQALVRKVGTRALGGYKSPAYCNNSLRGKVYSDIQNQIKREFGVTRYEAIKRSQLEQAIEIVKSYKTPLILAEEIQLANRQIAI